MVKNDGTADSKERRHNGNGWRGVGRRAERASEQRGGSFLLRFLDAHKKENKNGRLAAAPEAYLIS